MFNSEFEISSVHFYVFSISYLVFSMSRPDLIGTTGYKILDTKYKIHFAAE